MDPDVVTFITKLMISETRMNAIEKVPSTRARFYQSICPKQNFLFRENLISYIAKNPSSPNVYQKMIETCKYFFDANPILIFPIFYSEFGTTDWNTWFHGNAVDLKTIVASKLWILCEINLGNRIVSPFYPFVNPNVCNDEKYFSSTIIPKIYQSDIHKLKLWNQTLSFKDFVFIASNVEQITFMSVMVVDENGEVVAVEKLVEVCPKIVFMEYNLPTTPRIVTPNTMQELLKIPHFSNVEDFCLNSLPEAFDIDKLFAGIKANKKTTFRFSFSYKISDEYKIRLKAIITEIVETKDHDYKIPLIDYPRMDDDDNGLEDKLYEIFNQQK